MSLLCICNLCDTSCEMLAQKESFAVRSSVMACSRCLASSQASMTNVKHTRKITKVDKMDRRLTTSLSWDVVNSFISSVILVRHAKAIKEAATATKYIWASPLFTKLPARGAWTPMVMRKGLKIPPDHTTAHRLPMNQKKQSHGADTGAWTPTRLCATRAAMKVMTTIPSPTAEVKQLRSTKQKRPIVSRHKARSNGFPDNIFNTMLLYRVTTLCTSYLNSNVFGSEKKNKNKKQNKKKNFQLVQIKYRYGLVTNYGFTTITKYRRSLQNLLD